MRLANSPAFGDIFTDFFLVFSVSRQRSKILRFIQKSKPVMYVDTVSQCIFGLSTDYEAIHFN